MLKVLIKKELMEVFRTYFYDSKKNKAKSKKSIATAFILFALLMVVVLGGMFAFLSWALSALGAVGLGWLYYAIMGLVAVLFGVFGSVFNTYSSLYCGKDNDLLLSMPIPVKDLMIARLINVYLMGLMYSGVVIIPAIIIYLIFVECSPAVIIGGIVMLIEITLIDLVLSCILGWVVAKISKKLKHKSFITVFISLVVIGAYYFFYFKFQVLIRQVVENAEIYAEKIQGSSKIVYYFGSVGTGSLAAMIISMIIVIAALAVTFFVMNRSFLSIATSQAAAEKTVYKEKKVKEKSIFAALLGKELSRFTSSANYMLNCGLGILFIIAAGVAILIKGNAVFTLLGEFFGEGTSFIAAIMIGLLCLIASMNDMAAPSISLEGKAMWLSQVLPIEPWQCVKAKIAMQLVLTEVPVIFCSICVAIAAPASIMTGLDKVFCIVIPAVFVFFMAVFDMYLGIRMPNFTWTSEIKPIKQSGNIAIALFGGWVLVAVLGALYVLASMLMDGRIFLLIALVALAAVSFAIYRGLKKNSAKYYAEF